MEWNVGMVAIIADMILQRGRKRGKGGGGYEGPSPVEYLGIVPLNQGIQGLKDPS